MSPAMSPEVAAPRVCDFSRARLASDGAVRVSGCATTAPRPRGCHHLPGGHMADTLDRANSVSRTPFAGGHGRSSNDPRCSPTILVEPKALVSGPIARSAQQVAWHEHIRCWRGGDLPRLVRGSATVKCTLGTKASDAVRATTCQRRARHCTVDLDLTSLASRMRQRRRRGRRDSRSGEQRRGRSARPFHRRAHAPGP
jgi:hypothetical protein